MKRVSTGLIVSLALVGWAWGYPGQRGAGVAGTGTQARSEFIILGTASGPNSEANRAQPANALLVGGQPYLVDAGDGAVAQLAKANLRVSAVRAVFLSHLHFDHTAGMLAVIGLRMQLETRGRCVFTGLPAPRRSLMVCSPPPRQPCVPDMEYPDRDGVPTSSRSK